MKNYDDEIYALADSIFNGREVSCDAEAILADEFDLTEKEVSAAVCDLLCEFEGEKQMFEQGYYDR